jgi:MarR family transcriptional regulator, organic hydroperoxide resistance regulator
MQDTSIYMDFFRKTIRMGNRLRRVAAENLSSLGYNWNKFDVLRIIRPGQLYMASEIAEKSVRLSSNLTPILNELEEAGVIERIRDSEDRRIVRIRLTENGIAERERILVLQRQYITEKLKPVNKEAISEILAMFEKIDAQLIESGVYNNCSHGNKLLKGRWP